MAIPNRSMESGHFARKQILSRDRLISWSHRRRFQAGLHLAQQFAGQRLLDYGCGDGTFLTLLMSGTAAPAKACGAELLPGTVADCRERLSHLNINFVLIDELQDREHRGAYDAIVCMEVLEHVLDFESVLDRFLLLLTSSGKLIVSVPVETGIPLLIKQAARRVAGWRGIGDYPGTSPYSLTEYSRALFAGPRQSIVRPIHKDEDNRAFHDHKGFNWMVFREALAKRFQIERTFGSPVGWLTPHLASQVWFVASRKST